MGNEFITDVSLRVFLRGDVFRNLQDLFLERHGRGRTGLVLEVGADRAYGLHRFFPDASRFVTSNLSGAVDARFDVTRLGLADASVSTLVCVSVLEHVDDLDGSVAEIARVLAPDGVLLLTVPFLYPVHDTHDVRRIVPDAWPAVLGPSFRVETIAHLGGRLATLAALLQRPRRRWSRRFAPQKVLGVVLTAVLGRFDTIDDSPTGAGIVARRVSDQVPGAPSTAPAGPG